MQGRRGGIFGINVNVKFCQGLFSSSLLWDVIEIYKLVLSACKKKKITVCASEQLAGGMLVAES